MLSHQTSNKLSQIVYHIQKSRIACHNHQRLALDIFDD
tara:strand:- start:175 stop:288 length:114 start_codon:yes stop_codon:yes gene_type:complete